MMGNLSDNFLLMCKNGDVSALKTISLDALTNDYISDALYVNAYLNAIDHNHLDIVRCLHSDYMAFNELPENRKKYIILHAISLQRTDLYLFLMHETGINDFGDYRTFMYDALTTNNCSIMSDLITHHTELNSEDWINVACLKGDLAVIDYLSTLDGLTCRDNMFDCYDAYVASLIKKGHVDVLKTLSERYAWNIEMSMISTDITDSKTFLYLWENTNIRNEPNVQDFIQKTFFSSIDNNILSLTELLLENPTTSAMLSDALDDALYIAVNNHLMWTVEYLLSSPNLSKHANVHMKNNILFNDEHSISMLIFLLQYAEQYIDTLSICKDFESALHEGLYSYKEIFTLLTYLKKFDPVEFYSHFTIAERYCQRHNDIALEKLKKIKDLEDIHENHEVDNLFF